MKWIYPSVLVIVAAYMWKIDTGNSNAALALSIFFAIAFVITDWNKHG